jgi:hypothetical protein
MSGAEAVAGMKKAEAVAKIYIPRPILASRLKWLTDGVVLAIARWSRETPKSSRTLEAMATLIEEFIAYGVTGCAAPPGAIDEGFQTRAKARA